MIGRCKTIFSALALLILVTGCNQSAKTPTVLVATDKDFLGYLAPVIGKTPNNDTATCLILTTNFDSRRYSPYQNRPYVKSVQIIDAAQPWPPRWYTATPVYTDDEVRKDTSEGYYRQDNVADAKVVQGFISFFKLLSRPPIIQDSVDQLDLDGFMLLNDKMECVDTVKGNTAFRNLYLHDFSMNLKGEKLLSQRKDSYLDLRDYTGRQADYCRHCEIDVIEVLNAGDSVIFSWNPLDHIAPQLFRFKEHLGNTALASNDELINWTRLTSTQWDYDDNILYSMENLGIGKLSYPDGHVIWQVNYNQMPMITGHDTVQWYCQHDFKYLYETDSTAVYSLYSNGLKASHGDSMLVEPCGLLFELNKKTFKIKALRYQHPKSRFITKGQGGYDYESNGDYVLSYGFLKVTDRDTAAFSSAFEYGHLDSAYCIYQLPKGVICYRAHRLENFKIPPRPVITVKGDELQVKGDMKEYTWYKLSGPNNTLVEKVGSGSSIKYGTGGVFCVEGKYGIGYAVSTAFSIYKN
jgi:hypothetical protein